MAPATQLSNSPDNMAFAREKLDPHPSPALKNGYARCP